MQVNLIKPYKHTTISYVAQPLLVRPDYACVRAMWTRPAVDLGYMQFAPGDILDEHFYADKWYCVFTVFRADGQLRGWYCNVTKPASIYTNAVTSVDLELDLFVAPDRIATLRLDVDEFEAQNYRHVDAQLYETSYAAMTELELLARSHSAPFDRIEKI